MIDISVQNIKKAFEEGNDILDGITFDVNEGERGERSDGTGVALHRSEAATPVPSLHKS